MCKKIASELESKALVDIYREEILDTRILVSNLFARVPVLPKEYRDKGLGFREELK